MALPLCLPLSHALMAALKVMVLALRLLLHFVEQLQGLATLLAFSHALMAALKAMALAPCLTAAFRVAAPGPCHTACRSRMR